MGRAGGSPGGGAGRLPGGRQEGPRKAALIKEAVAGPSLAIPCCPSPQLPGGKGRWWSQTPCPHVSWLSRGATETPRTDWFPGRRVVAALLGLPGLDAVGQAAALFVLSETSGLPRRGVRAAGFTRWSLAAATLPWAASGGAWKHGCPTVSAFKTLQPPGSPTQPALEGFGPWRSTGLERSRGRKAHTRLETGVVFGAVVVYVIPSSLGPFVCVIHSPPLWGFVDFSRHVQYSIDLFVGLVWPPPRTLSPTTTALRGGSGCFGDHSVEVIASVPAACKAPTPNRPPLPFEAGCPLAGPTCAPSPPSLGSWLPWGLGLGPDAAARCPREAAPGPGAGRAGLRSLRSLSLSRAWAGGKAPWHQPGCLCPGPRLSWATRATFPAPRIRLCCLRESGH
ncbi:uncharacterized protein [Erythrolamprus reginae]|uniref:uncharacterized protein n=1 Tax=Erythrolamprus reginae TaxID=121349 RepID=UPI00396C63E5